MRNACDLFKGVYEATGGVDGRVSIEVEPGLAMDTEGTSAQAADLWKIVDRPNVLIKIPATKPGLPAIANAIGEGISVNVTLIFSLDRYRAVMDAYLTGLEQADANGHDLSRIQSVASFFISRVDSEVDKRLDAIGSDEAKALKGKAAIANGRLAYAAYEEVFASERFAALQEKGANRQRPLWASTGVKNPDLPDTLYVTELVVANTVNTMPEKTMQAFADHGELLGDRVSGTEEESAEVFSSARGRRRRPRRRLGRPGEGGRRQVRHLVGRARRDRADRARRRQEGQDPGRVHRRGRPQQLSSARPPDPRRRTDLTVRPASRLCTPEVPQVPERSVAGRADPR